MREHLESCAPYLRQQAQHGIVNGITSKAEGASKNQPRINFPTISAKEKDLLDLDFAAVCYVDGRPFTLYETPTMKRALHRLNPAYKPPNRQAIAQRLLDNAYEETKNSTNNLILSLPSLNIVSDESNNINGARIANISIHHPSIGSFHYLSQDIGTMQSKAVNIANWLKNHLQTLTNGDFKRINSIATDTCDTMLSMWEVAQFYPELKHCFCIPCDSHGMQLLIKDILKIPQFKDTIDKAQAIARAFKKSHLQYARLREYQLVDLKKPVALTLSVITRWGSQLQLVMSVIKNKRPLRHYALEYPASSLPYNAHEYIQSLQFWSGLEDLHIILECIDKAIKMSESNRAHLGYVLPRWRAIFQHLEGLKKDFPVFEEFLKPKGMSYVNITDS